MEQEPKEKQAGCSSAPVTGYATVSVGFALQYAERPVPAFYTNGSYGADFDCARALAAEVRRLREALEGEQAVNDALLKALGDKPLRAEIDALLAEVSRLKSHNIEAELRAQRKGNQ